MEINIKKNGHTSAPIESTFFDTNNRNMSMKGDLY